MIVRPLAAACLLFLTIINSAHAESGIASVYGYGHRKTASGERADPTAMTAAHRTLAFGTRITVSHMRNGAQSAFASTTAGLLYVVASLI